MRKVQCNEHGTPFISDLFLSAQSTAITPFVCYVNADIILMKDFVQGASAIASYMSDFVLVSQRWDIDVDYSLSFRSGGWEQELRELVGQRGTRHGPFGIDWFVFPKGLFSRIPPFLVGRPGWDNWMLYDAVKRHIPIVDASQFVTIVHQNHGYPPNVAVRELGKLRRIGPEAKYNRGLVGAEAGFFGICDANWRLDPKGQCEPIPISKPIWRHLVRSMIMFPAFRPVCRMAFALLSWLSQRKVR